MLSALYKEQPMEISLCMIVKNEESCLANCLNSVCDLVDEIVIVDTGSTDKTKEIAACYTDKIYDFEWINDFSAARNFAFSKGTKDYLMWLDADDIITEENRKLFLELKRSLKFQFDIISMDYMAINEKGLITDRFSRERIIKRRLGLQWQDKIHEHIDINLVPKKKRHTSHVAILHTKPAGMSTRNLEILEEIMNQGNPSLRTIFNYAAQLCANGRAEEGKGYYELFFEKGGLQEVEALYACIRLYNQYMAAEQYEKALELLDKCSDQCIDRAEYCCLMAQYHHETKKDIDQTIYWYERALKCQIYSPKFGYAMQQYYYYLPYYNLGQIYASQGRLEESRDALQKALEYLKQMKK